MSQATYIYVYTLANRWQWVSNRMARAIARERRRRQDQQLPALSIKAAA